MKITFDGKSGKGFSDEGQAKMHVQTMVDRAKAEFGLGEESGVDKLHYLAGEGTRRVFVKGSISID